MCNIAGYVGSRMTVMEAMENAFCDRLLHPMITGGRIDRHFAYLQ